MHLSYKHQLNNQLIVYHHVLIMLDNNPDKKDFLADIDEMEKMLTGYLSFAKGEGKGVVCINKLLCVAAIANKDIDDILAPQNA